MSELLTRRKGHVFATFRIGTATSASRQSCISHTRATQNDMSTASDTSKRTRFCDFSHRHGNFSLMTVLHLTHVECHKVLRLPRKTTWAHLLTRRNNVTKSLVCHPKNDFHILWNGQKRQVLQLSLLARGRHHTTIASRLTRHVESSKRAFRSRLPPLFTLCTWETDVFLRVFSWSAKFATSKSMFRAKLPSIFMTCHKMPRLPRLVTTSCSADNAIRKKHATRHVQNAALATQNDIGGVQSVAPATKCNTSSENVAKVLRLPHKTISDASWNMLERHKVPRLPRKTTWPQFLTRNKSHVSATFPIGTATLRPRRPQTNGCKRLQTVADGCKRLQTVADAKSTVTRTRVNPQTPKCKTRTLRYAFGNNEQHCLLEFGTARAHQCPWETTLPASKKI